MSISIRERILQTIVSVLSSVASSQGATVWRTPSVAITREQCPALVVFAEGETIAERANERVSRELTVRITAVARAVPPAFPETLADELLCAAHVALMKDTNLGGLALAMRELECDWEVEDADAVACAIPARYQVSYRTLACDISVQG